MQSPGQGVPDPCSKTLVPELARFLLALQFRNPARSGRPEGWRWRLLFGRGLSVSRHSDTVPGRCCCPCEQPLPLWGDSSPCSLPGQLSRAEEPGTRPAVPEPQERGAAHGAEPALG